MTSYRIWWLIAFCALVIGIAIETVPVDTGAAGQAAASSATPTPVAGRRAEASGG